MTPCGINLGLASRVLALAGLEHVTHDDFFDLARIYTGTLEGLGDGDRAKLARRSIGQGSKVTADGGTRGAEDHNLSRQGGLLSYGSGL